MTRVRSQNATRPLVAAKRQNIGAERRVKEALIEHTTNCLRLLPKHHCSNGVAESPRNLLCGSPSRIHIGLDLDHGDRTLRQRPIGLENRVATILPTLVDQPLTRPPYSTKPSPSRSPYRSIHSSAASTWGQSRRTVSRSSVRSR